MIWMEQGFIYSEQCRDIFILVFEYEMQRESLAAV
jgi:hypothetical protein